MAADKIIDVVELICGVNVTNVNIKSNKRQGEAKDIARYLLRKYTTFTHKEIAMATGAKDHSSSIKSFNHINNYIYLKEIKDIPIPILNELDMIEKILNNN